MIVDGVDDKNFAYDEGRQTLFILHDDSIPGHMHILRVSFDPPVQPTSTSASSIFILPFGYVFASFVLLAAVAYHVLH